MKVVHRWLENFFQYGPPPGQKHEELKYVGDGFGLWAVGCWQGRYKRCAKDCAKEFFLTQNFDDKNVDHETMLF